LPLESFERALEEEMSMSAEFDLPLTLLVVRAEGELNPETTRRLLRVLRIADLVTLPSPSELAVALQNTGPNGARAVERRVLEILPDADFGLATREPDDEVSSLLERARSLSYPRAGPASRAPGRSDR
jgi:hypothetical protein